MNDKCIRLRIMCYHVLTKFNIEPGCALSSLSAQCRLYSVTVSQIKKQNVVDDENFKLLSLDRKKKIENKNYFSRIFGEKEAIIQ